MKRKPSFTPQRTTIVGQTEQSKAGIYHYSQNYDNVPIARRWFKFFGDERGEMDIYPEAKQFYYYYNKSEENRNVFFPTYCDISKKHYAIQSPLTFYADVYNLKRGREYCYKAVSYNYLNGEYSANYNDGRYDKPESWQCFSYKGKNVVDGRKEKSKNVLFYGKDNEFDCSYSSKLNTELNGFNFFYLEDKKNLSKIVEEKKIDTIVLNDVEIDTFDTLKYFVLDGGKIIRYSGGCSSLEFPFLGIKTNEIEVNKMLVVDSSSLSLLVDVDKINKNVSAMKPLDNDWCGNILSDKDNILQAYKRIGKGIGIYSGFRFLGDEISTRLWLNALNQPFQVNEENEYVKGLECNIPLLMSKYNVMETYKLQLIGKNKIEMKVDVNRKLLDGDVVKFEVIKREKGKEHLGYEIVAEKKGNTYSIIFDKFSSTKQYTIYATPIIESKEKLIGDQKYIQINPLKLLTHEAEMNGNSVIFSGEIVSYKTNGISEYVHFKAWPKELGYGGRDKNGKDYTVFTTPASKYLKMESNHTDSIDMKKFEGYKTWCYRLQSPKERYSVVGGEKCFDVDVKEEKVLSMSGIRVSQKGTYFKGKYNGYDVMSSWFNIYDKSGELKSSYQANNTFEIFVDNFYFHQQKNCVRSQIKTKKGDIIKSQDRICN